MSPRPLPPRPGGRRTRALTAVLALAFALASCSTPAPEPLPTPIAPTPPPVALSREVAEAASIYVAFTRAVAESRSEFPDAAAIQAYLSQGAAYKPSQLSRGMIAYASILALQSPDFMRGVRAFALDPEQKRQVEANILADPAYAAALPGAAAAADLILEVLGRDIDALTAIADAVEADAYKIQDRQDPRRRWAVQTIADRAARLENAKSLSALVMAPSGEDAERLFEAAHAGSGLDFTAGQTAPPYTPAVVQALAVAALAGLGSGGEEARPQADRLLNAADHEFCLTLSKLNLFQCLAASRPSYEDMFCIGRHVVRDLAICARSAISLPSPDRASDGA